MSFKVTQHLRSQRSLRTWGKKKRQGVLDGAKKAAETLLELSQPLVPVDKGQLKASGEIVRVGNGYSVVYSALNKGFDYAYIQHENLEYHHDVGQAKYLEQPFRENMENLMNIIVRNAREAK